MVHKFAFPALVMLLSACSAGGNRVSGRDSGAPSPARDSGTGTVDGGPGTMMDGSFTRDFGNGACTPSGEEGMTAESCSDGIDNNCDGRFDCSDLFCSGVGSCPVCGQVETKLGAPLALPDGEGDLGCSNDMDCPGDQRCFEIEGIFGGRQNECRESYRSTLNFIGFGDATFDSVNDIVSLCVEMEHSWMRDIEIALEAPSGQRIRLQAFLGQDGNEIYMGNANDDDDSDTPVPGTGATYCWTPTATRPSMLQYANEGGTLDSAPNGSGVMPPGDYSAAENWGTLIGTPLNGNWSLLITDLWPEDNGYIFEWSITFDPSTVDDCASPLI